MTVPSTLDLEHRRCIVGGEPTIFHCHHYNVFLQQTLRDAEYVETAPLLVGAGAEVAYAQLSKLFADGGVQGVAARRALAAELHAWAGFGAIDLSGLGADGGAVSTPHSHYALGWKARNGASSEPVCFFTSGWLAGAAAAIHGLPAGSFAVSHEQCAAMGEGSCRFELTRGPANYSLFESPGVGMLHGHEVRPVPATPVDYEGILAAVGTLPLVGNEQGFIPAFGVYLTRHYANYYNRVSFEFLRLMSAQLGAAGREAAEPLLVEAGHVCAFNTFGGIMTSTEWDALIRPSLKTREDWVHGIIAVVNALGWGRWQVTSVSEAEAEFVLHDDYESVGYRAAYGKAAHPVSYLAQGGVAGLMNLVYVGDIASRPTLDRAFYERLFKDGSPYVAEPTASLAMGDAVTAFRVRRA